MARTHWLNLDLSDLCDIILVVYAIPENITKISQRSLQCICRSFFLCLLETHSFALTILDHAVPYVLQ